MLHRLGSRTLDLLQERVEIQLAAVTNAIHEKPGSCIDAVLNAPTEIFPYAILVGSMFQFILEELRIEGQLSGIPKQILFLQSVLMLKKQIVHLPKPALDTGSFRGFSSHLRMGVNSRTRIMPISET